MDFFTVNGVRIAATISGTPGATPLILLHSGGSTRSTWDDVAPAFATTHHVHALDMRGYGDSDRPGAYSFELMRDDVLAVLDQIGADQVHLIGHSLGGTVAWLVAEEQPARIARMVVEDTVPAKPPVDVIELGPRPEGELAHDWAALEAIVGQLNNPDSGWWDRMPQITAPVLLLAGGPESHVRQDHIVEAAKLLGAQLVEIPVGHHIHREALDRFLAVTVPFLTA